MIGRLRGMVVSESADGTVVVDVQGVGYEVLAPLGTLGRAPRDKDGAVTLLVHTNVREDAIQLFAFANEADRGAFRLLIGVAGVGPKTAVGILGALSAQDLVGVVARGDAKRFQSVPGVGKKIAERLVLELKDKVGSALSSVGAGSAGAVVATTNGGGAAAVSRAAQGSMGALVNTLVNLGFKPLEAERAAAELAPRSGEPLDILVRDALKILTH